MLGGRGDAGESVGSGFRKVHHKVLRAQIAAELLAERSASSSTTTKTLASNPLFYLKGFCSQQHDGDFYAPISNSPFGRKERVELSYRAGCRRRHPGSFITPRGSYRKV